MSEIFLQHQKEGQATSSSMWANRCVGFDWDSYQLFNFWEFIRNLGYGSTASLQLNVFNVEVCIASRSKLFPFSYSWDTDHENLVLNLPFSVIRIPLIFFLPCWQGIALKDLQLDFSTTLKSPNVFKRSICVEALLQLRISTRIWQKPQCRKMADSCAVRCLLVHCFIFGSCFCTWYLQLFLKLLQRIIIHFMKWLYFTHPTGHWFTYFPGSILWLSELRSLLQGCVHWDVTTSWAVVLLHELLRCGVTVFNYSFGNTEVTGVSGRWKQPEFSCFPLAVMLM